MTNQKSQKKDRPIRIATKYAGVYYRVLKGKHLGKPDKNYSIRVPVDGVQKEFVVGKTSEGMTAELANQIRIQHLSEIHAGTIPEVLRKDKPLSLEEAANVYFKCREDNGKSTYSDKGRYEKHVQPFFGAILVKDITLQMLDEFKLKLLSCQAPSSAKKQLTNLRAIINHAIKYNLYTGKNPFSTRETPFTLPKEDNESERYLTRAEARDLLVALAPRSSTLHDMAFISLYTGMRATEIFGLKSKDIDIENRVANIYAKGGERQQVLLEDPVLKILSQHITTPDNYLFPDRNGNRRKAISDSFVRAVDSLGLNDTGEYYLDKNGDKKPIKISDSRQKVIFHTLRHTFASWLAQSGKVGIYELMKLMRHKDINMTLRYAHLIPDKQREHISIIGQIMTAPDEPSS